MDTNLVGYLLGNLDAETHRQVEARLRSDPRARAALARIRRQIRPLAALRSPPPPPSPGLARRTMARLAAHRRLPDAPPLSPGQRTDSRGFSVRRADLAVAALVLAVVLACLGPWLAACQRQAQVRAGQQNLAQLWMALRGQADTHTTPASFEAADVPGLRPESSLAFSCASTGNDRSPLLLEPRDPDPSVPPAFTTQNVLFVGGQVHCYDQSTADLLSSCPVKAFLIADPQMGISP